MCKRIENMPSHANLYTDVYRSIVSNSLREDTTHMSVLDAWIKKMWYVYII